MNANYDLVIVGGGVGGAALAGGMASAGARVLVLEAESRFRDRVRGEAIMPWGVAEVKLLGLEHTLIQAAANPLPFWDSYAGADRSSHRDLRRTTSVEEPALACYHPKLQESLLRWAEGCGAEVRRGVRVTGLDTSGNSPTLSAGTGGEISGRLIVGADGRGSTVRALAGFQTFQDAGQNLVSGVLMKQVALAEDATHAWLDTSKGHFILHFPQGEGPLQGLPLLPRRLRPPVQRRGRRPSRARPLRGFGSARGSLCPRRARGSVGHVRRAFHLGGHGLPKRRGPGWRRRRQLRPNLRSRPVDGIARRPSAERPPAGR